jgi:hypothetical protein
LEKFSSIMRTGELAGIFHLRNKKKKNERTAEM